MAPLLCLNIEFRLLDKGFTKLELEILAGCSRYRLFLQRTGANPITESDRFLLNVGKLLRIFWITRRNAVCMTPGIGQLMQTAG
jgi:hypothetical protein